MDARYCLLTLIDEDVSRRNLKDYGDVTWNDGRFLRECKSRFERGELDAWEQFLERLAGDHRLTFEVREVLLAKGFIEDGSDPPIIAKYPPGVLPLDSKDERHLLALLDVRRDDTQIVVHPYGPSHYENRDKFIPPTRQTAGEVMYVESKPGLIGEPRIGRVRFSKTRKTLYYAGRKLQSLKGGYKVNYYDVENGDYYWVSRCRKDGNDTLYPGVISIDEDAREEYWVQIRELPENKHLTKTRSEGKYAKRRPR